jgi:hypothetical protein
MTLAGIRALYKKVKDVDIRASLKGINDYLSTLSSGSSAFTSLTDVPNNYTGDALKVVRVNAGETGLEFVTPSSGSANAGTTTVNFGSFPGGQEASVAVTGQTGILSGSVVQAWIIPTATADHSADEHLMANIKVVAGNISAGVGFTIYAFNNNQLSEPILETRLNRYSGAGQDAGGGQQKSGQINLGGTIPKLYGQFTVGWSWI